MIFAGIVAGGMGSRFGSDIPKQFLKLGNKPIIVHTVEKFLLYSKFDAIFIGVNENWIPYALGRRVGAKFPIQVNTEDDLYKWLTIYPMGAYYSLQYNGLINESYISNLIEIEKEYKTLKQTSINISDTFTYEELINGGIRRIFHNIINLRTQNLIFPLIYNEALLIDNDWKMVMKLIARYNEHLVKNRTKIHYRKYVEPYETLFSYYKNIIKTNAVREPIFNKELVISIFQFVRENDYELFKDFYEYRGEEVRK